jgi:hypothetical protein
MEKITPYHFQEIIKKGYSLDLIYLMKLIQNNVDITNMCEDSVKIGSLHSTLIRKGLLTDHNTLTLSGEGLLSFLNATEDIKLVNKKPNISIGFDAWWKAFPGTDIFIHKGKKFNGCRNLKSKKEDCRLKLSNIINEGEYTIEQLIGALEYDVLSKKNSSVQSNTNKLTYMQNSYTYLHQRSYEPFIELINKEEPITEISSFGGTDI